MRTRLLALLAAALMAVVGAVVFTAPASAAGSAQGSPTQDGSVMTGLNPVSSAQSGSALDGTSPDGSFPGDSASDGPGLNPLLCGDTARSRRDNDKGRFFLGTGINIRTGPSTSCTSLGQGQPSHLATYWCFTGPIGGFTWTFLIDNTTNVFGWVRDDLLVNNGSNIHC